MKSALELALEKTKEVGKKESKPLTDTQKEKIAEIRKISEAKIAELKIMWKSKFQQVDLPPNDVIEDKNNFLNEKKKIEEKMEQKIKLVRQET